MNSKPDDAWVIMNDVNKVPGEDKLQSLIFAAILHYVVSYDL